MRRILALACLLLFTSSAWAQTLPSVEAFSPGLGAFLSEAQTQSVKASWHLSLPQLLHIRDVSVLQGMLGRTRIETLTGKDGAADRTEFQVLLEEEPVLSGAVNVRDGGLLLQLQDQAYSLPLPEMGDEFGEVFSGSPLERMDLACIRDLLRAGTVLPLGISILPCSVQETWSDDGLRLTRLDVEGQVSAPDGEWTLSGYLRRPGGKSPKNMGELKFVRDDQNALTLTLSGTYAAETIRKDKEGKLTGNVRVKAEGKLGGYGLTVILALKTSNTWRAEEEKLRERISANLSVTWQDKTPGRQYLHLNEGKLTLKQTLTVQSSPEGSEGMQDSIALTAEMDGNTVAEGNAEVSFTLQPPLDAQNPVQKALALDWENFSEIAPQWGQQLAMRYFRAMDTGEAGKVMVQ